jgi:hypothetical protein
VTLVISFTLTELWRQQGQFQCLCTSPISAQGGPRRLKNMVEENRSAAVVDINTKNDEEAVVPESFSVIPDSTANKGVLYKEYACAGPCGCSLQVEQSVKIRGVMLHVPLPVWKWLLLVTNLPFFCFPLIFLTEPSATSKMNADRIIASLLMFVCGLISTYFHGIQCFVSPKSERCRAALLLDMAVCSVAGIILFALLISKGLLGEFLVKFWWLVIVSILCISPQFSMLFKVLPCLPAPDGLMYTITHSLWHICASFMLCAISRAIIMEEIFSFGPHMFFV